MEKLGALLLVLLVVAVFGAAGGLVSWLAFGAFWPGAVAAGVVRLFEIPLSAAVVLGKRAA